MQSRLKFRGKRKGFKEWLYYDIPDDSGFPPDFLQYQLDVKTIGQFLGIEGKDWWEGDILGYEGDKVRIIIVWNKELACFGLRYDTINSEVIHRIDYFHIQECIKLGNIHDNPELLKNKHYGQV